MLKIREKRLRPVNISPEDYIKFLINEQRRKTKEKSIKKK